MGFLANQIEQYTAPKGRLPVLDSKFSVEYMLTHDWATMGEGWLLCYSHVKIRPTGVFAMLTHSNKPWRVLQLEETCAKQCWAMRGWMYDILLDTDLQVRFYPTACRFTLRGVGSSERKDIHEMT
jgi:hypothetical protein